MSSPHIPLNELAAAVQSAVQQVLGKHGAVPVEKLWVGFVAPENLANQENAAKLAAQIAKSSGVHAQPSLAQLAAPPQAAGQAAHESHPQALKPGHIIGLVFDPSANK